MAIIKWKRNGLDNSTRDLDTIQKEINDLFNMDFFPNTRGLFDRNVFPALDVIDHDSSYLVHCELPGVEKDDVDVTISGNVLTIKGEKKEKKEDKDTKFYRRESTYGAFQRTLSLPKDTQNDKVTAKFEDGILKIEIPKMEEAKRRSISIDVK